MKPKLCLHLGIAGLSAAAVFGLARVSGGPSLHAGFQSRIGHLNIESPQVNPIVVSRDGRRIYACNTANDTLSVFDTGTRTLQAEIPVGLQPVSVAVRPDDAVLYVSNHLSDTISVVDPTLGIIITTIQDVVPVGDPNNPDPQAGISRFGEPAQVAFNAAGTRAFVALSEMNQVAIIDAQAHTILSRIDLNGSLSLPSGEKVILEDPRALTILANGRFLAVAAFESGNRSETQFPPFVPALIPSDCNSADQDLLKGFLAQLSFKGDILTNPSIPDRDVVVIDTVTSQPLAILNDAGTLLYGLASRPNTFTFFLTHTDARNTLNGATALGKRPWLNRMSRVVYNALPKTFTTTGVFDLDAPESGVPDPNQPAAVPYGIALAADGNTAYVTAASSDRLLFVNAAGAVTRRVVVGAHPTGVAVNPTIAELYVLNRLDNTISVVDQNLGSVLDTIVLGSDPLDPDVREGAKVIHGASFSETGTFSCASCHPAGGQDQLSWDLGGQDPNSGADLVGPRVVQTLRGLDGTAKFHWDGIFPTLLDLVIGTIEGPVMSGSIDPSLAAKGETYLESIPHIPGPHRRPDDLPSLNAVKGLGKFFSAGEPCATVNCHAAPFWTSQGVENSTPPIEAVSTRALNERNQILHDGRNSMLAVLQCFDFYEDRIDSEAGIRSFLFTFFGDLQTTAQQDEILAFFDETSTGLPGVLGAQVTLTDANLHDPFQIELFFRIWDETVVEKALLTADGLYLGAVTHLEWDKAQDLFIGQGVTATIANLVSAIDSGNAILTFTARLAQEAEAPMPEFLEIRKDPNTPTFGTLVTLPIGSIQDLTFKGRNFVQRSRLFVDGFEWPTPLTFVDSETLTLHVDPVGGSDGDIFALEIQGPLGRFTNELPVKTVTPGTVGQP